MCEPLINRHFHHIKPVQNSPKTMPKSTQKYIKILQHNISISPPAIPRYIGSPNDKR